MSNKYINFYNNLMNLTRNKTLYEKFTNQDTFSDRLLIFLFHFAFFLNIFKTHSDKQQIQEIFDYIFKQLEISIREIGYGDASINKQMKNYINTFYSILKNIENWEKLDEPKKNEIFDNYLNVKTETSYIAKYFENYRNFLKKSSFNSHIKGVIKPNF